LRNPPACAGVAVPGAKQIIGSLRMERRGHAGRAFLAQLPLEGAGTDG
jgi:hypothetical protein